MSSLYADAWDYQRSYSAGDIVAAPDGNEYTAMNNGKSGTAAPDWGINEGDEVQDGTITWVLTQEL